MTALTVKKYKDRITVLLGAQVLEEEVLERSDASGCGIFSNGRTVFSGIELLTLV